MSLISLQEITPRQVLLNKGYKVHCNDQHNEFFVEMVEQIFVNHKYIYCGKRTLSDIKLIHLTNELFNVSTQLNYQNTILNPHPKHHLY